MRQFTLIFRKAWLCQLAVIFSFISSIPLPAQNNIGYIQVTCEPGAQVYLDGELKGTTSEKQGGLIISGVSATRHLLRFEKEGYHVQEAAVDVGFLKVLEYRVRPFTLRKETGQKNNPAKPPSEKKVGSVLIQSEPMTCKISITALGVNGYEKYRDEVEFDQLPVGTYTATFSALGKSVDQTFAIEDGKCTRLFANLLEGKAHEPEIQRQVSENVPATAMDSGDKHPQGDPVLKPKTEERVTESQTEPAVPADVSDNYHAPSLADSGPKLKVQEEKTPPRIQQDAPAIAMDADKNRSISDLGLKLIWIEPGSLVMGRATGGEIDEKPVTQVSLSHGFWLGRTEVTQAQWRAIMDKNPARFQGDDRPVEAVNWNEAMEFCRKLTVRENAAGRLPSGYVYTLPTEAQWEYACRAGTAGDHAGPVDMMAWYMATSGGMTKPVGQKQANAWGLHDMHGNVWEWCLDWYGNYPGGNVTDPKGAASGIFRVMRGGSWNNSADYCRSGLRLRDEPVSRRNYLGFRLALSSVP